MADAALRFGENRATAQKKGGEELGGRWCVATLSGACGGDGWSEGALAGPIYSWRSRFRRRPIFSLSARYFSPPPWIPHIRTCPYSAATARAYPVSAGGGAWPWRRQRSCNCARPRGREREGEAGSRSFVGSAACPYLLDRWRGGGMQQ